MKTLLELAKELDFETEQEYYDYIVNSYVNGQNKQVKDLFNDMKSKDKDYFLTSYLSPLDNEIRNICIKELI